MSVDIIDGVAVKQLVEANRGRRGFTYTHHSMSVKHNRDIVKFANDNGFTINLSANNLAHADVLAALNIGPVVTVAPIELQRAHKKVKRPNGETEWTEALGDYLARIRGLRTPQGNDVIVCPATYRDDITCLICQLCARQRKFPNRPKKIVAFPAHGAQRNAASSIAGQRKTVFTYNGA